jgi:formate-dependent nitrite reductase cytochrome c552 subunit
MMRRNLVLMGLGILVILLALAGTGSARPSYGNNCGSCHNADGSFDGNIFAKVHKFDGISAPSATLSCGYCHIQPPRGSANPYNMSLTSNGSLYNSTHRYNATTLASVKLAAPACADCHVDVINNDFTRLSGTPTYLASTTCENCHKAKYDNWTNTLHRVMLTEKSKAQAMNLPEPEVGWANISYVIVSKFEFAYINTTGYFPAQNDAYETETEKFVNSSHAGDAYGSCGGCHTTNWNTSARNSSLPGINGTFSEPGIACERCHKPAGNGHQVVVNYSGDLCIECHTGNRHGTGWENGEHAPPPYENGTSCMFCHSSFDQYKNQNVTVANATGVSCGVCHNTHDMTDNKYAQTFSEGIFNATTWSRVADSKLSFFNATASIAAGTNIFDDLSNRLLYPGTDTDRKDMSYGIAPINVTGRPVSEVLCSMCHYRHGIAHMAEVNLTHSRMNYPQSEWATCTDCHMAGTNAIVGKDMMKNHANGPLTANSCGGTTKCHTTSDQNLSASSNSVIPVINEWKASAHNDKEVGVGGDNYNHFYWNNTTGVPNSRQVSCNKCHSPKDWNPVQDSNTANVPLTSDFNGITCAVCHNIHDMGDWLAKTKAAFGVEKAYAWYNKDAVVAAKNSTTGAVTRYKANYTMMPDTVELCGNCHSNIRIGNEGPGWNGSGGNPTGVHGFPAKDMFAGSWKQTDMKFECISCHMATIITDSNGSLLPDSQKVKGHSFKVNATILMNSTTCSSCHVTGSTLGNLSTTIENIQAQTRDKWNATNITVLGALATIKAYDGEKNLSRDLIAESYWNLRMVSSDESWGVHNPNRTIKLLDDATALANDSLAKLGQSMVDSIPPATMISGIIENGSYINSVTVDLNATDNESGVNETFYKVNGGPTATFSAPFIVHAIGRDKVTYWSTDKAGNVESRNMVNFTIVDTIPPVTTRDVTEDGSYNNSVTVTLNATDNGSGVNETFYMVNGGPTAAYSAPFVVDTIGPDNLTYWSTDKAGNIESQNMVNFTIVKISQVNATATRKIESKSILPGESTIITVNISRNVNALALHEIPPEGWNLTRGTDSADDFKNSTNEWVWKGMETDKTATYTLTAPDKISIGTYQIEGTIRDANGILANVEGDNSVKIDILEVYRRLGDDPGIVETMDLLRAFSDFRNNKVPQGFDRPLSAGEVNELIKEWINS